MTDGTHVESKHCRSLLAAGGAVVLLALLPACSSSTTPAAVSSTTVPLQPPVTLPEQSPAALAACAADAQSVEVALETYMASEGAYPTPPMPWSAGTYSTNYGPLTTTADGGPYLHDAPTSTSYVIEYDAAGHVWVEPPGAYGTAYNPAQDFNLHPNACLPAVS